MRISDWSSDVCSSDLSVKITSFPRKREPISRPFHARPLCEMGPRFRGGDEEGDRRLDKTPATLPSTPSISPRRPRCRRLRSEEHTSELQSLMRISYAVFCLKKKKQQSLPTQHSTEIK